MQEILKHVMSFSDKLVLHQPEQGDAAQVGRRSLLLSGSILGLLADFIVAVVFAVTYTGGANLPESASVASIVLVGDPAWHSNIGLSATDDCLQLTGKNFDVKLCMPYMSSTIVVI